MSKDEQKLQVPRGWVDKECSIIYSTRQRRKPTVQYDDLRSALFQPTVVEQWWDITS